MSALTRYRDMKIDELKALIKKTKSDRATMKMRVTGADVSAYDAQISECEKELARRCQDGERRPPGS